MHRQNPQHQHNFPTNGSPTYLGTSQGLRNPTTSPPQWQQPQAHGSIHQQHQQCVTVTGVPHQQQQQQFFPAQQPQQQFILLPANGSNSQGNNPAFYYHQQQQQQQQPNVFYIQNPQSQDQQYFIQPQLLKSQHMQPQQVVAYQNPQYQPQNTNQQFVLQSNTAVSLGQSIVGQCEPTASHPTSSSATMLAAAQAELRAKDEENKRLKEDLARSQVSVQASSATSRSSKQQQLEGPMLLFPQHLPLEGSSCKVKGRTSSTSSDSTASTNSAPKIFDFVLETNNSGSSGSDFPTPKAVSLHAQAPQRLIVQPGGSARYSPTTTTSHPSGPAAVATVAASPCTTFFEEELIAMKSKQLEVLWKQLQGQKKCGGLTPSGKKSRTRQPKAIANVLNTMKVFVRHLADETTEEQVFYFACHHAGGGRVQAITKQREFGGTHNCAFVTFDSVEAAEHFVRTADGSCFFVKLDEEKKRRLCTPGAAAASSRRDGTHGEEKEEDNGNDVLPPLSVKMAESLEERAERVKRRQAENLLARAAAAAAEVGDSDN